VQNLKWVKKGKKMNYFPKPPQVTRRILKEEKGIGNLKNNNKPRKALTSDGCQL
jgi:hypothetical protein